MNCVMDYLYLKCINRVTKEKYVLGALCRDIVNNVYYFKLNSDYASKAKKCGVSLSSLPFNDANRIYESKIMFPIFRTDDLDLSDVDTKNDNVLGKMIDEFEKDYFELLKKHGTLKIDNLVFEEDK